MYSRISNDVARPLNCGHNGGGIRWNIQAAYVGRCWRTHSIGIYAGAELYACLHAQIFNNLEVPFTAVNILEDERLRSGMKEYSQWPTFPQAGTLNQCLIIDL